MRNFRPECRKSAGFTLIEVLIAIGLLSLMSIAIYQVTSRSLDVNFKLGSESTDYVAIVLSLQTVEADLAQIYSPVIDETPQPTNRAEVRNTREEEAKEPSQFWSAPVRSDGMRRSRLVGTKEKITFINNGNIRVEADSPQSDFQRVTWEIERNDSGAYSLYRTTDWDAFQYEDGTMREGPPRVALMENLSSASFTYYRKENKTWEDQWDSEGRFVKPESRFPDLISLKIEVPDPTNTANQQQWEVIVKPHMQLNAPPAKAGEAGANTSRSSSPREPTRP